MPGIKYRSPARRLVAVELAVWSVICLRAQRCYPRLDINFHRVDLTVHRTCSKTYIRKAFHFIFCVCCEVKNPCLLMFNII
jgi:hypothetical protein